MTNDLAIDNDDFGELIDEDEVLEDGILVTVPTKDASIAPAVIRSIARRHHVIVLGITNCGVRSDSTLLEVTFFGNDEDDIDDFITDVDSVEMPRDYRFIPSYAFNYTAPEIGRTLTDEQIDNLLAIKENQQQACRTERQ